jgi:hypothetical protein
VSETSNYRAELTSRLRSATEDIAWSVRGLPGDAADYKPSDDEWSIREHLAHLADMEQQVYLPLLRWATVPDMLDPLDYNRREWHERRYHPAATLPSLLDDLSRMRDEELAIFREMTDVVWTRWRTDTRWGPLTCQWIAEVMYRHALDHLQGIMALRQDINLAALQPPPMVVGGYIGGRERA